MSGETWEFAGRQWTKIHSAAFEGRFNSVMAYDEARSRVIRFGGRYGGRAFGDTWEYDGHVWRKLTSSGPTARNHTALVYDRRHQKIILFGGHDLSTVFGDMWEWDGDWLIRRPAMPEKRIDNGH